MWFFSWTETDKLKQKIEEIVEKEYTSKQTLWYWCSIKYLNFHIQIQTTYSEDTIFESSNVTFNNKEIFNAKKDLSLFMNLRRIIQKKNKSFIKRTQELSLIWYKTTIAEALAVLTSQEITNVSKEVKDEFDPIFNKVKRVMEITKELEGIRKEFSIT